MRYQLTAVCAALILCNSTNTQGQGMSVNTTGSPAAASAMLDISSTTKGALLPRMTKAQRMGIASPASGLTVYQTDGAIGYYYNAGTSSSPSWSAMSCIGQIVTYTTPGTSPVYSFTITSDLVRSVVFDLQNTSFSAISISVTLPSPANIPPGVAIRFSYIHYDVAVGGGVFIDCSTPSGVIMPVNGIDGPSNILLSSSFTSLYSDGTNWIEMQ